MVYRGCTAVTLTPNCHLVDGLSRLHCSDDELQMMNSGCIGDDLQIGTLLMVYEYIDDDLQIGILLMVYEYTDDDLQIVTLLMVYEYTDDELQIVTWWISWRLKMKLLCFLFHPSCLKRKSNHNSKSNMIAI